MATIEKYSPGKVFIGPPTRADAIGFYDWEIRTKRGYVLALVHQKADAERFVRLWNAHEHEETNQ